MAATGSAADEAAQADAPAESSLVPPLVTGRPLCFHRSASPTIDRIDPGTDAAHPPESRLMIDLAREQPLSISAAAVLLHTDPPGIRRLCDFGLARAKL